MLNLYSVNRMYFLN